ncbi:CoA transferase [Terrarubrum flagellatum]|uniref:CoA transferase n=1 Tax=Terrirubrum flagellatum TaxID=2895980 RepID=UPI003144E0AC
MDSVDFLLVDLWSQAGGDPAALERLRLTGEEPSLPSSFRVGAVAQTTIAAAALAAAEVHHQRGAARQDVSVDMRHASIEFRSERYFSVDGAPAPELWDMIAGVYRCGDGRWVRLHTNFPHHRDGVLALLNCVYDKGAVAQALSKWKAEEFEAAAAERKLVVAMMRSFEEWDAHPHDVALAGLPLFSLERIGDAPPETRASSARPLSGVRVLELTRIIAGPVCGRTLAVHGADVMLVTAPHLPSIDALAMDTGRGKLATSLDLRDPLQRESFARLVRGADIIVQGYRPGGLADLGFGPEECAKLRPGIIYVSLSAYSHDGPWADRRGFDSLVQTATGFNHAEAEAAGSTSPKPLPCQALDHGTGYLMAFVAMMALARRAREGGSWHARLSLAQTARWMRGLGRLDNGLSAPEPSDREVNAQLETTPSGFGTLTATRHAAMMSATQAKWERPSVPLGFHAPQWPERA